MEELDRPSLERAPERLEILDRDVAADGRVAFGKQGQRILGISLVTNAFRASASGAWNAERLSCRSSVGTSSQTCHQSSSRWGQRSVEKATKAGSSGARRPQEEAVVRNRVVDDLGRRVASVRLTIGSIFSANVLSAREQHCTEECQEREAMEETDEEDRPEKLRIRDVLEYR